MKPSDSKKSRPGHRIEHLLDIRGWSQHDTKSITLATARGLEAAFGSENGTAQQWLLWQLEYQISVESAQSGDCSEVARRAKLHSLVPLREMVKRGWVSKCDSVDATEHEVAMFFGASSIEDIIPPEFCARARVRVPAQNVWAQNLEGMFRRPGEGR